MKTIDIVVRYSSGAYNTNRHEGKSSSSTMSAAEAASRQASKIFGQGLERLERVGEEQSLRSTWRAVGRGA